MKQTIFCTTYILKYSFVPSEQKYVVHMTKRHHPHVFLMSSLDIFDQLNVDKGHHKMLCRAITWNREVGGTHAKNEISVIYYNKKIYIKFVVDLG